MTIIRLCLTLLLFLVPIYSHSEPLPGFNKLYPKPDLEPITQAIIDKYRRPEPLAHKLVYLAEKYSYPDFPNRSDILAIMAVESSFNPNAYYLGNTGVMQINLKAHPHLFRKSKTLSVEAQVKHGVEILRRKYLFLKGNVKAAVLAYNVGAGAYLKGEYDIAYFNKWTKYRAWVERNSGSMPNFGIREM